MKRIKWTTILVALVVIAVLTSCSSRKSSYIGTWKLTTVGMFGNVEMVLIVEDNGVCILDRDQLNWELTDEGIRIFKRDDPSGRIEGQLSSDGKSIILRSVAADPSALSSEESKARMVFVRQ